MKPGCSTRTRSDDLAKLLKWKPADNTPTLADNSSKSLYAK